MDMTQDFNNFRRAEQITSVELADFVGVTRRFMLQVETGSEAVKPWMFQAVDTMKRNRRGE